MNHALWTAIREYIAAETRLALLRHERQRHALTYVIGEDTEMCRLEEQSTRMETSVRDLIGKMEQTESERCTQDILHTPLS